MAQTKAQRNRAIRQESIREKLAAEGHIQHINTMVNEIMDKKKHMEAELLNRYKVAIDAKMKLINKYLPDLKAQEISGPGGEPLLFPKLTTEEAAAITRALDEEC